MTQNVDGLHQRAGHRRVVDLHGQLAWVDCLDCRLRLPRAEMQALLEAANRLFATNQSSIAPDGDAVIAIINRGQTRADTLAAHKLDADVGHSLLSLTKIIGIEVKPVVRQCSISR